MPDRNLLFLSESTAPDLLCGTDCGWNLTVTSVADDAIRHTASQRFFAGAIEFSGETLARLMLLHEELLRLNPQMLWIAVVPPSLLEDERVRRQLRTKFYDFHTKPFDPQRLLVILGHAHGMALLEDRPGSRDTSFRRFEMIGKSAAMQDVFRGIEKAAAVDYPVLISGESGTGKDLTARAIHMMSKQGGGPFVTAKCASPHAERFETELFDILRGDVAQRCETSAGTPTIYLDNIDDLTANNQLVLLRFLHASQNLGVGNPSRQNPRVIASCHGDIDKMVRAGTFKEELYYRLNVLSLKLPALRDRGGDIELIARDLFDTFRHLNMAIQGLSEGAVDFLHEYDWPGNIRELSNRIQKAILMSENRWLTAEDLGQPAENRQRTLALELQQARQLAEKDAILAALRQSRNNLSVAAKTLNISRMTLYRLMEKIGLNAEAAGDPGMSDILPRKLRPSRLRPF